MTTSFEDMPWSNRSKTFAAIALGGCVVWIGDLRPGNEADALLAQLCTDPDANVRYRATDAIAERSPAAVLVTAVSALAVADSALQVRAKAVNLVAEWYPKDSALGSTLHQVESHDTNADLRNVAKAALGQG